MATRTLEFPPKTTRARQQCDIAVAWITVQNGGFQTPNVTAAITRELKTAGFQAPQSYIKHAMDRLVAGGYAVAEVIGKRTVAFVVDPDVEVPEPAFLTVQRMTNTTGAPTPPRSKPAGRPPIPNRTPAVFGDLHAAVLDWWRLDPDNAVAWATEALESLR
jgi:hypothetical protein